MKRVIFVVTAIVLFAGCAHTPYANVGVGKTINIGGLDVGVHVGDILHP